MVLESINKFFRKESCLDRIRDMIQNKCHNQEIDEFFNERQVLTEWGSKRFYKISKVRMDMNPKKAKFNSDGEAVTVLDYFKDKYSITLDPN